MKRKLTIYTETTPLKKAKRIAKELLLAYLVIAGVIYTVLGGFNWVDNKVHQGLVKNYLNEVKMHKQTKADLQFSISETDECRRELFND